MNFHVQEGIVAYLLKIIILKNVKFQYDICKMDLHKKTQNNVLKIKIILTSK